MVLVSQSAIWTELARALSTRHRTVHRLDKLETLAFVELDFNPCTLKIFSVTVYVDVYGKYIVSQPVSDLFKKSRTEEGRPNPAEPRLFGGNDCHYSYRDAMPTSS